MSLAELIRKRDTANLATAIPAISATQQREPARNVAGIATVAVANPSEAKIATLAGNVGADDTAIATSWGWLLHYADREPLEAYALPEMTHAEVLALHPDAVAAEPIAERSKRTANTAEAAELRELVEAIYSGDTEADRAEAVAAALADPDAALICYRSIAIERGIVVEPDDRRTCGQCANLRFGVCTVASPDGAVTAATGYRPSELFRITPHRCDGYAPSLVATSGM